MPISPDLQKARDEFAAHAQAPEFYSRGANAIVLHTTVEQRLHFSNADFMRLERSRDITWAQRYFLQMQLAAIALPNNIIQVVGWETDPIVDIDKIEEYIKKFPVIEMISNEFTHRPKDGQVLPTSEQVFPFSRHTMFSKKAKVPDEHAVYCAHMKLNQFIEDEHVNKISLCDCPTCQSHRQFHEKHDLANKAKRIHFDGIYLPNNDPSDYCLSKTNDIVFFEIMHFFPDSFLQRINQIDNKAERLTEIEELVNQYKRLYKIADMARQRHLGTIHY